MHGLLVVNDGWAVGEAYFNGWTRERPKHVKSIAKVDRADMSFRRSLRLPDDERRKAPAAALPTRRMQAVVIRGADVLVLPRACRADVVILSVL